MLYFCQNRGWDTGVGDDKRGPWVTVLVLRVREGERRCEHGARAGRLDHGLVGLLTCAAWARGWTGYGAWHWAGHGGLDLIWFFLFYFFSPLFFIPIFYF